MSSKTSEVYLSSKHKRRGYLGGVRYQNRVLSKYLSLCTCNYPFYSAYKSLIQLVNFGQFKLSTDIEKNPGPSVYVDATKTINAPYCQENVTVFEENGGQRCVAMSLCALIYSKITKITSVDDMTQIMIVGNQLYSGLSLLARQSMLMLTELYCQKWLQCLSDFSSLNTVKVILVACMVMPELRGITTVCYLKHSWPRTTAHSF